MCRREFSTASCWYLLISAGSVSLKTRADRLARLLRVLLHLPVGEQRQLVELLAQRHPLDQRVDAALRLRGPGAAAPRAARAGRASPPPRRRHRPGHSHPQSQRRDEQGLERRAGAHDASVPVPVVRELTNVGSAPARTRVASRGVRRLAILLAMLVAVLAPASNAAAASPLHDYAKRTWASFVGHDRPRRPGCRPTSSTATAPPASRRRRPTSAPTCGAPSPRTGSASSRATSSCGRLSRTITTLEHMERYGDTGQYYNWYDHRTGEKLTAWPPQPEQEFHPILSSVDNGWLAVGLKIVASTASGRLRAPRAGALRRDGLRLLLPARQSTACCSTTGRTTPPPRRAATTRWSARAGSSTTSASRAGSCRRRSTTAAGAPSRTPATTTSRRPSRSGRWRQLLRRGRLRGRLSVQRHAARALVGRLDVRGADARPVRARGELGAATAGARTTRSRCDAQIFHGMTEAGYGYWGFSPANRPEGDYGAWGVDGAGMDPNGMPSNEDNTLVDHGFAGCPDRARRSPTRRQSAYTNGVVTPHAAFLALRYAPRRDRRERRAARARLPRPVRQVGLPRQRERPDGARLRRLPLARPGDDHGRARQRARRRRAAARVRRPRGGASSCAR